VDTPTCLDAAARSVEVACDAVLARGTFSERAAAIRKQMRAATTALVRSGVLDVQAQRLGIHQTEFQWEPPARGPCRHG